MNKMVRLAERENTSHLSESTNTAIKETLKERAKRGQLEDGHRDGTATGKWKHAIDLVIHGARSRRHYRSHLNVSTTEHMSSVDPFDGSAARKGQASVLDSAKVDQDLLVISPEVDGRLEDIARASDD